MERFAGNPCVSRCCSISRLFGRSCGFRGEGGGASSSHRRKEALSLTNTSAQTAKIFSTPEFHAAVLGLNPVVAVFDCDGTLWSGDAGTGFMRWTMGQGEGARGILSPQAIALIEQ